MEIQPSYSKMHNDNPQKLMSNMKVNVNCCNLMKVKVNCYNPKSLNDEMNVFFSVEMGNSLFGGQFTYLYMFKISLRSLFGGQFTSVSIL